MCLKAALTGMQTYGRNAYECTASSSPLLSPGANAVLVMFACSLLQPTDKVHHGNTAFSGTLRLEIRSNLLRLSLLNVHCIMYSKLFVPCSAGI